MPTSDLDLQPGMDPANPHDNVPLYLRDQPPVVMHERDGDNWVAVRVTHAPDQVWLYIPVTSLEAIELLAADQDTLDDVVAGCTTGRSVLVATAYEGRIVSTGWVDAQASPLATAHQWITTHR